MAKWNEAHTNRPLLVYDGDCAFCAYWVRYWNRLTGDAVHYAKYQDVAAHFPNIAIRDFQRSIRLIYPKGKRYSGARAAFQVLNYVPGKRGWLWLYRIMPAFAWMAERSYDFVSRRRIGAAHWSRILWGKELYPDTYKLVDWLFLRLLGLIYFAAFASMAAQVVGLAGSDGILPFANYLSALRETLGDAAYWQVPNIFWLDASDTALSRVCFVGMLSAWLIVFNVITRPALLICFVLYLSFVYAGQEFMIFQWDALLLEAGFLAIFLPGGSRIIVFLYRWLVFRFMLLSGVVKIASGDPSWLSLTALRFHYETQPLPTPLAWHAHHFPDWLQHASIGAVLFIELLVPFLVFFPRRLRIFAAWNFILLQIGIILTGNYNFFNLLTILLCLFLFEDRDVAGLLGTKLSRRPISRYSSPGKIATGSASVLAMIVLSSCGTLFWMTNLHRRPAEPFATIVNLTTRLNIVNLYGPFAVMTRERIEIVIEGSNDGNDWLAYGFKYKPGDLGKGLTWNIPHQPRLDWQMWFAPLNIDRAAPWFGSLLRRLRAGSPSVLSLFEDNPFPKQPPRYIRASSYRYAFNSRAEKIATGQVWTREYIGSYWPSN